MKKTKVDPSQFDLFAGTDFAPPPPQQKKPTIIKRVYAEDIANEKDILIRFAKKFKHSLAFLECALSGKLPGNYHGKPLWIRQISPGVWVDESIEDPDYWIDKMGYKLIPTEQIIYIVKFK